MYRIASLARVTGVLVFAIAVSACDIAVDGHGGFDFGMAAGKAQDEWTRSYPLTGVCVNKCTNKKALAYFAHINIGNTDIRKANDEKIPIGAKILGFDVCK